jgi:hypothetical protein
MKIKEIIKNIIYKKDLEKTCVDIWKFAEINFDYQYYDLTDEELLRYVNNPELLLEDQIKEFIIDYLYKDIGFTDCSSIYKALVHFDRKMIGEILENLIIENKIERCHDSFSYLKLTADGIHQQEKLNYSSEDFYINPEKYLIFKKEKSQREKFQKHLNMCSERYSLWPEWMKQSTRGIFNNG